MSISFRGQDTRQSVFGCCFNHDVCWHYYPFTTQILWMRTEEMCWRGRIGRAWTLCCAMGKGTRCRAYYCHLEKCKQGRWCHQTWSKCISCDWWGWFWESKFANFLDIIICSISSAKVCNRDIVSLDERLLNCIDAYQWIYLPTSTERHPRASR